MYINGEYRGDDALGKLMHDFSTPNADEMIYDRLADKVRFYKQNETGVRMASKIVEEYGDERAAEALKKGIQQGLQQGIQQGIEQGEKRRAIEDAKNLYANKVPIETIAKSLKMTISEVQNIINS